MTDITKQDATNSSMMMKSMQDLDTMANIVLTSGLTPLDTVEAVKVAILLGKELGLQPMVSVQNIYAIGGKAGQTVRLINALALKNKVTHKVIRDFELVHTYSDANGVLYEQEDVESNVKEGKWTTIRKSDLNNAEKVAAIPKDKKCIIISADRETKLEFTRVFDDGRTMTVPFTFNYSEAVESGLVREGSVWAKRPRVMCYNRALTGGIRLIGDDFLLGLSYEATELMDSAGVNYDLKNDGTIEVIDDDVDEIQEVE